MLSYRIAKLSLVLLAISIQNLLAQSIDIVYADFENETIHDSKTTLRFANDVLFLSADDAKIQSFMDFKARRIVDMMTVEGSVYRFATPFDSLAKPTFTSDVDTILGRVCKHAWFSSFSNKIEVWYIESEAAKGSPYKAYWPTKNALVLKVLINGNYGKVAQSISSSTSKANFTYYKSSAKACTAADFEEIKIKSRYSIFSIYKDEVINFEGDLEAPKGRFLSDKTYRFSKGTIILKKIKLPESIKSGAYVYARLSCQSLGDAYDRTGSVFVMPAGTSKNSLLNALQENVDVLPFFEDKWGEKYQGFCSSKSYDVPIEVMRFFTSFGAGYFNNRRKISNYDWQDEAKYKADITAQIPSEVDSIWIGVFIGNYNANGHKISLDLDVYPGFGESTSNAKLVKPLFLTVNVMEMSGQNYGRFFKTDTLEVSFDVPENAENLALYFTSTGHGGWGGGDEFNPKRNTVLIDEKEVFSVTPWRTDCATYRNTNPASGNFENGLSSSDLSRSNWCPATLTAPYIVQLPDLKSGAHTIKVTINQGVDEGGSFSHWGVSGVLVGEIVVED